MTCHDCQRDTTKGYRRGKRWYCDPCYERAVTNRKPPARFLFSGATKYRVRSEPPPEPFVRVYSNRPRDPLKQHGHGIINANRLKQEDIALVRRAVREGWTIPPVVMKRIQSVGANEKRDTEAVAAAGVVLDAIERRTT